jgi:ABC-type glycerol-3-phosphate transport system permease component
MNEQAGESLLFKLGIYGLLIVGSFVFGWPLLWMMGTSFKADRELFSQNRKALPLAPLVAQASPYNDTRYFDGTKGPHMDEIMPLLENTLSKGAYQWASDTPREEQIHEVARGIYQRMRNMLPEERWKGALEPLSKDILAHLSKAMVDDTAFEIRRNLMIGQLQARSYDLQEDRLVLAPDAAKAWNVGGPAKLSLLQTKEGHTDGAELHYDYSSGDSFSLSQTFTTSFPVSRLYRIQIGLKSDDSWHPLVVKLEKGGKLYEAERVVPMADYTWAVYTFQEPGPDDMTNKIRTWVHLNEVDGSGSYESDPHKMKVILEWQNSSPVMAWFYKMRRNYLLVFDNMPFWRYTATSIFLVVLNLVGTLLSCSVVAYAFARLRWPGRNMSYGLMLATMMMPAQATMIPFFLIVRYLGLYNTLIPLWAMSFFTNAFFVFLLHQFYKGVPTDLEDAAKIDGCGSFRIYWYIMMPLVKPSLATITIFTFMGVWNDFMGPLIYLNDQRLYPLSLGLFALNVQAGASMSMLMAGALLMLLPVVLIFFFFQRYFIQGIALTGMKG